MDRDRTLLKAGIAAMTAAVVFTAIAVAVTAALRAEPEPAVASELAARAAQQPTVAVGSTGSTLPGRERFVPADPPAVPEVQRQKTASKENVESPPERPRGAAQPGPPKRKPQPEPDPRLEQTRNPEPQPVRKTQPEPAPQAPPEPRPATKPDHKRPAKKQTSNTKPQVEKPQRKKPEVEKPQLKKPEAEPAPERRPKRDTSPPVRTEKPGPSDRERRTTGDASGFDLPSGAIMSLTVEAIGLRNVPVAGSSSKRALDNGVIHMPETSLPWDNGKQRNVYLVGHRMGWRGTGSYRIFYNLHKLHRGDRIVLTNGQGRRHEYRVTEALVVEPHDTWVMDPVPGRDILSLQTCTPIPSFEKRLIVRADRVK